MPRRRPKRNLEEAKMIRNLDQLAEFERFQESILPILKQAIEEKWSAERIWSHPLTQALLAAQAVRIGLQQGDAGKALDAIKTIVYQTQGKPKEQKEITHKVGKLKDEELDSLLKTQLSELGLDDSDFLN